jgi:hypothetical protein
MNNNREHQPAKICVASRGLCDFIQRMIRHLREQRSRIAAGVMLAVYLCTLPALLPMAFAALARLEGSHGVEVTIGGDESLVSLTHGAMGVRLPHEAIHHHCLFARVLASFSEPRNGGDPDHIVRFASGSRILDEPRIVPPPLPLDASACAPEFSLFVEIVLPDPMHDSAGDHIFSDEHAPPDSFLGLKSTRLLI